MNRILIFVIVILIATLYIIVRRLYFIKHDSIKKSGGTACHMKGNLIVFNEVYFDMTEGTILPFAKLGVKSSDLSDDVFVGDFIKNIIVDDVPLGEIYKPLKENENLLMNAIIEAARIYDNDNPSIPWFARLHAMGIEDTKLERILTLFENSARKHHGHITYNTDNLYADLLDNIKNFTNEYVREKTETNGCTLLDRAVFYFATYGSPGTIYNITNVVEEVKIHLTSNNERRGVRHATIHFRPNINITDWSQVNEDLILITDSINALFEYYIHMFIVANMPRMARIYGLPDFLGFTFMSEANREEKLEYMQLANPEFSGVCNGYNADNDEFLFTNNPIYIMFYVILLYIGTFIFYYFFTDILNLEQRIMKVSFINILDECAPLTALYDHMRNQHGLFFDKGFINLSDALNNELMHFVCTHYISENSFYFKIPNDGMSADKESYIEAIRAGNQHQCFNSPLVCVMSWRIL